MKVKPNAYFFEYSLIQIMDIITDIAKKIQLLTFKDSLKDNEKIVNEINDEINDINERLYYYE
tara:strand:- start:1836 stop:2024 length:189 start_codon:yes stop_codon:yes gene_type:complete